MCLCVHVCTCTRKCTHVCNGYVHVPVYVYAHCTCMCEHAHVCVHGVCSVHAQRRGWEEQLTHRVLDSHAPSWLEGVLWVRIEPSGGCCPSSVSAPLCFSLHWGLMTPRVTSWITGDKEGCLAHKRPPEREWCTGAVVTALAREAALCALSRWAGLGSLRI